MKYFLATRPYVVSASLIPFTIGALLSIRSENFSFFLYILGAVALLFIHLGSNSANDYFDYKNNIDRAGTFGSSGSRLLIRSKITLQEEKWIMIVCFMISLIVGIYITFLIGFPVLFFGIAGIIGGYFYTANPVHLKYRGWGVPLIFSLYGPLITLGGQYLMVRHLTFTAFIFSLIIGFPVANIALANEIRDTQNDIQVKIKSFTIIFGDLSGAYLYLMMFLLQYILLFYEVLIGRISPWTLIALVSIPIYLSIIVKLFSKAKKKIEGKDIINVDITSSMAQLFFGIGIIVGLIV